MPKSNLKIKKSDMLHSIIYLFLVYTAIVDESKSLKPIFNES